MFDVSHMARLWLKGVKVVEYLEWITANDISKLVDGKGQYSLLPNENGGTVDDIIVYSRKRRRLPNGRQRCEPREGCRLA